VAQESSEKTSRRKIFPQNLRRRRKAGKLRGGVRSHPHSSWKRWREMPLAGSNERKKKKVAVAGDQEPQTIPEKPSLQLFGKSL